MSTPGCQRALDPPSAPSSRPGASNDQAVAPSRLKAVSPAHETAGAVSGFGAGCRSYFLPVNARSNRSNRSRPRAGRTSLRPAHNAGKEATRVKRAHETAQQAAEQLPGPVTPVMSS